MQLGKKGTQNRDACHASESFRVQVANSMVERDVLHALTRPSRVPRENMGIFSERNPANLGEISKSGEYHGIPLDVG